MRNPFKLLVHMSLVILIVVGLFYVFVEVFDVKEMPEYMPYITEEKLNG